MALKVELEDFKQHRLKYNHHLLGLIWFKLEIIAELAPLI